MSDKLTLIKVGGDPLHDGYIPTPLDLEKWRDIFEKAKDDPNFKIICSKAQDNKEISVEEIDLTEDPNYVTLVKVNSESESGTRKEDLEAWREIFEEAKKDPSFVIFTHYGVTVERVKLNKDTKIIVGDAVVIS